MSVITCAAAPPAPAINATVEAAPIAANIFLSMLMSPLVVFRKGRTHDCCKVSHDGTEIVSPPNQT